MDTKTLEKRISDLTSSLGDPTRRAIYIAVRESADALTTSQVAALFGIHPNVARHHLDRLTDDGYLEVSPTEGRKGGAGAGRPAKAYSATAKEVSVHFAPRRFEDRETIGARQIEVGHDHTDAAGGPFERRDGTEAVVGRHDRHLPACEVGHHQVADIFVVIDHEDVPRWARKRYRHDGGREALVCTRNRQSNRFLESGRVTRLVVSTCDRKCEYRCQMSLI